jgi:hypothetical protein
MEVQMFEVKNASTEAQKLEVLVEELERRIEHSGSTVCVGVNGQPVQCETIPAGQGWWK